MKDKQITAGINDQQWNVIGKKTPPEYTKTRAGRGGKSFTYVETGYIIELLNKAFNGMWDFEITEQEIGKKQIWVKGRLTVKFLLPTGDIGTITKTQFGGKDIAFLQGSEIAVDIGDDLKAATSDCLKKCASMLGIANDIYWKGDHLPSPSTEEVIPEPPSSYSLPNPPKAKLCQIHNMRALYLDNPPRYSHKLNDGTWCNEHLT